MPEFVGEFYVASFPAPAGGALQLSPVPGLTQMPGDLQISQISVLLPALGALSCAKFWGVTGSCHRMLVTINQKG